MVETAMVNEPVSPEADSGLNEAVDVPTPDSAAMIAPETTPRHAWRKHGLVLIALAGLCASLYAWTADFPLVFDDHTYMIDNPLFRHSGELEHLKNFEEFVTRPGRLGTDPDYAVNFVMRPVAYLSLYWNYLYDGFKPRSFRVVNIIIHALNSMLIYALLTVLLRQARPTGGLKGSSMFFISATAALIFVAHPLAIESVTYIIQRFESLMVMFGLLSLWLYFMSLTGASRRRRGLLRGAALVSMLLAMQTKEPSVMLPLLAVILHWLVCGTRLRHALLKAWPLLICVPLIPVLVVMTTYALHGGFDWHASLNIVNSRDEPLNHWHYAVTQITVVADYLRLMFWPSGLNLDPEWPIYDTLWDGHVLRALAVLVIVVGVTGRLFRRFRGDARFALAFVFTLWFFVTVSVSSGLVPLPDMKAEHRSYLPSVGIFVVMAVLLDRLRTMELRVTRPAIWVPGVTLLCIGALSWKTCSRNEVWRTGESLWKDTVVKSPGKFRTWGNLGTVYSVKGNENKAVECYQAALKIEPRFQNGLFNLSNSLLRLNRPKESLATTMELIRVNESATQRPPVAFTLGLGLAGVGKYDQAASVFREILRVAPNDTRTLKALGLVYHQSHLPYRALEHYQRAARVDPYDKELQALIAEAELELKARFRLR
jgi:hypothetical protein